MGVVTNDMCVGAGLYSFAHLCLGFSCRKSVTTPCNGTAATKTKKGKIIYRLSITLLNNFKRIGIELKLIVFSNYCQLLGLSCGKEISVKRIAVGFVEINIDIRLKNVRRLTLTCSNLKNK